VFMSSSPFTRLTLIKLRTKKFCNCGTTSVCSTRGFYVYLVNSR
jgi:hypothetical protein